LGIAAVLYVWGTAILFMEPTLRTLHNDLSVLTQTVAKGELNTLNALKELGKRVESIEQTVSDHELLINGSAKLRQKGILDRLDLLDTSVGSVKDTLSKIQETEKSRATMLQGVAIGLGLNGVVSLGTLGTLITLARQILGAGGTP
jgi:hypothetical protein